MRTYFVRIPGGRDVEIEASGFEVMKNGALLFFRTKTFGISGAPVGEPVEDVLVRAFAHGWWEQVRAKDEPK